MSVGQSFGPSYLSDLEERALDRTFSRPRVVPLTVKSTLPTHPTIPGLFPRESVNLLSFTPKIGTWRFLLPQLANYAAGRPFLAIPHPCPRKPEQLGVILCNKQVRAMREKIVGMGLEEELDEATLPIVKWESKSAGKGRRGDGQGAEGSAAGEEDGEFALDRLYEDLVEAAGMEPTFVIVDSIYLLLRSRERIGDPVAIGEFTDRLYEFCRQRRCTVLGTIPTAKTRPGDEYQILSHRIYGSVQWGVSTSCLMLIERYSELSTFRRVRIEASLSRNEHETRWVDFDLQGRLMLRPQPESAAMVKTDMLEAMVAVGQWEPERRYARAEILAMVREGTEAGEVGISVATVDRWLKRSVEQGVLRKEGETTRARYWRPKPD